MSHTSPRMPRKISFCIHQGGESGARFVSDVKRLWPESNRADPFGGILDPEWIILAFFRAHILRDREPHFVRSEKAGEIADQVYDLPQDEQREHWEAWNQRRMDLARNAKWYRMDENATRWDWIVVVAPDVMEVGLREDDRYPPTSCGAVEQWRALARTATRSLNYLRRSLSEGGESAIRCGHLGRDATEGDLVVATTETTPVFATYRKADAPEEEWDFSIPDLSLGYEGVKFTKHLWSQKLTWAGRSVIYWAHALVRIRRLYDRLDAGVRLRMASTTEMLAKPKPILEWKRADLRQLEAATQELVAAAPLLGATASKEPERTNPPPGFPVVRMPTVGELRHAAKIKPSMFRRIRIKAGVIVKERGRKAAQRPYSFAEIRLLRQAAEHHFGRDGAATASAWIKWS